MTTGTEQELFGPVSRLFFFQYPAAWGLVLSDSYKNLPLNRQPAAVRKSVWTSPSYNVI